MVITSVKIRNQSIKPLLLFVFIYMIINLSYTLIIEPVYSVVTFKDLKSYIYILAALLLVIAHNRIGFAYSNKYK